MVRLAVVRLEPTKKPCGITCVNSGNGYVLGNNRAGANDDLIADRDWKDGGICSDAYTIPKSCCSPKVRLFSGAPGNERIVDEHGAMRNEAFVSDRYELTDERVRLDPASLSDSYSLLDLYERADKAGISNCASIEIDRLYDRDVFTKCYVDNPCMADFWLCHKGLA